MSLKNQMLDNKTIGFKLTIWYSGFFVLSVSLLFILAYVFLSQTLKRDDHRAIKSQLNELSSEYAKGGPSQVMTRIKSELVESKKFRKRSHFFFRFASRDNNTTKIFFPHQWEEFDIDRLEAVSPGDKEWIIVPPKENKQEYLLEVASTKLPDGSWLQVGMSNESRQRVLNRFLEFFLYVGVFLLLTGIVSGYYLSRRALRPIRHIIQTVRTIETGKMDARVPPTKTQDELGELVRLFNNMLARIESLIHGMEESLDNVAHELRTPMTRMHNIAEAALQIDKDPEQYKKALENFVEESDRILKMLNTLMDISEAETGVMYLEWKEFKVKELIDPVVEVYSYIAEEKGLRIYTDVEKDLAVKADFNRISQVLANLLDNSIKYTSPDNPPISIKAWKSESGVVISVTDSGKGIADHEMTKIWDRLYRGEENRDGSDKGLGLGLAQVKAILRAHNGWVEVSSKPDMGSTFRVHLPQ